MSTTKETGAKGERFAEKYLAKKGYKIVANNYAVAGSELDIVAYKKGTLVFVEVKTRSGDSFGAPADAVNEMKRRKLRFAARGFWHEQQRYGKLPVWSPFKRDFVPRRVEKARLDIAEVYIEKSGEMRINIIENDEEYDWLI